MMFKQHILAVGLAALVACGGGGDDGGGADASTSGNEATDTSISTTSAATENDTTVEAGSVDTSAAMATMIDSCVADGGNAERCECSALALFDNLEVAEFLRVAENTANGDDEAVEAFFTNLDRTDPSRLNDIHFAFIECM